MSEIFSTQQHGNVTVLTLESTNVDTSNVAEMERALQVLISEAQSQVVIDLSQLTFVSSAGLRSLLIAAKQARKHGGDLRLAGATPKVAYIFELVGMKSIFRFYTDVANAVASFGE